MRAINVQSIGHSEAAANCDHSAAKSRLYPAGCSLKALIQCGQYVDEHGRVLAATGSQRNLQGCSECEVAHARLSKAATILPLLLLPSHCLIQLRVPAGDSFHDAPAPRA